MAIATEVKWDGEARLNDRQCMPYREALYCAFQGDKVLYVGRSDNLRMRWLSHPRLPELRELDHDELPVIIKWQLANGHATAEDEQALMDLLHPELNRRPAERTRTLIAATMHYWDDQLEWLKQESRRREDSGKPNASKAAIVREALDAFMKEGE